MRLACGPPSSSSSSSSTPTPRPCRLGVIRRGLARASCNVAVVGAGRLATTMVTHGAIWAQWAIPPTCIRDGRTDGTGQHVCTFVPRNHNMKIFTRRSVRGVTLRHPALPPPRTTCDRHGLCATTQRYVREGQTSRAGFSCGQYPDRPMALGLWTTSSSPALGADSVAMGIFRSQLHHAVEVSGGEARSRRHGDDPARLRFLDRLRGVAKMAHVERPRASWVAQHGRLPPTQPASQRTSVTA